MTNAMPTIHGAIGLWRSSLLGMAPQLGLQDGDPTASGPGPQRRAAAIFRRRRATEIRRLRRHTAVTSPALQREAK
jgi:hypothetical protein